jgi:hypothetical protein
VPSIVKADITYAEILTEPRKQPDQALLEVRPMIDTVSPPSHEAETPTTDAVESSDRINVEGKSTQRSDDHHTEGTPAAQGNETVTRAQNDFLEHMNRRITELEILSLVALELKLKGQLAAADSYGQHWKSHNRRAFNIVTRLKRRMKSPSITAK